MSTAGIVTFLFLTFGIAFSWVYLTTLGLGIMIGAVVERIDP